MDTITLGAVQKEIDAGNLDLTLQAVKSRLYYHHKIQDDCLGETLCEKASDILDWLSHFHMLAPYDIVADSIRFELLAKERQGQVGEWFWSLIVTGINRLGTEIQFESFDLSELGSPLLMDWFGTYYHSVINVNSMQPHIIDANIFIRLRWMELFSCLHRMALVDLHPLGEIDMVVVVGKPRIEMKLRSRRAKSPVSTFIGAQLRLF